MFLRKSLLYSPYYSPAPRHCLFGHCTHVVITLPLHQLHSSFPIWGLHSPSPCPSAKLPASPYPSFLSVGNPEFASYFQTQIIGELKSPVLHRFLTCAGDDNRDNERGTASWSKSMEGFKFTIGFLRAGEGRCHCLPSCSYNYERSVSMLIFSTGRCSWPYVPGFSCTSRWQGHCPQ